MSNDFNAEDALRAREEGAPAFTEPVAVTTPPVQEDRPRSLGQVDVSRRQGVERMEVVNWVDLRMEELPSGGLFYPEGTTIQVRPAYVGEIKYFSGLEEDDIQDIEDRLNYVLEKCSRVKMPGMMASHKDIKEIDRLRILFEIRAITFAHGETKLLMDITCPNCGNGENIELSRDHFNYLELDEQLMKYYDPALRAFNVQLKNGESFVMHLPSLGIVGFMRNFVINKTRANQHFDKTYAFKFASFDLEDWRRVNEATFGKAAIASSGWSPMKLSGFKRLVDLMKTSIDPNITHDCGSCGSEVVAPLNFRGGFASLFIADSEDIFA
jgi:hypothetical protein